MDYLDGDRCNTDMVHADRVTIRSPTLLEPGRMQFRLISLYYIHDSDSVFALCALFGKLGCGHPNGTLQTPHGPW